MYQDRYTEEAQKVKLDEAIEIKDLLSQMGTFLQIDTTEDDIYDETDDIDYEKDAVNEFQTDHLNFSFAELKLMMTELSDGIFKRIITPGSGEIVFSTAKVTLCYSAYWEKENTPFDSTFFRAPNETFILGENMLQGLAVAVLSMKKGETSEFIVPYQLLFGELGCFKRIKPKADGLFTIKLINFVDAGNSRAFAELEEKDKNNFSLLKQKSEDVNKSARENFKTGKIHQAIRAYHDIITMLQCCAIEDLNDIKERNQILYKTFCNLAVCYNRRNDFKKVFSICKEVRKLPNIEDNCKILFQEARAMITSGDFIEAGNLLQRAIKLEPNNLFIQKEINILKNKLSNYKKSSEALWRKAFKDCNSKSDDETVSENTIDTEFRLIIIDMCNSLLQGQSMNTDLCYELTVEEINVIEDILREYPNIVLRKLNLDGNVCYSLKKLSK